MAGALAAAGHEVSVVTAPPYYPEWRLRDGYRRWWYQSVTIATLNVVRCPLWVPGNPSGLRRLLHLLSFALTSFPAMLRFAFWRPHLIWVVEPTLMCAPAALAVGWFSRASTWLHIQDLEVDAAFDLGLLRSRLVRQSCLAIERFLMRRFDKVSTISGPMLERVQGKGVESGRGLLFPNWVDIEAIRPLQSDSPYRQQLGLQQSDVVALYAGSMGRKQGLEILAAIAHGLTEHESIKFVFCGNGPGRNDLEAKCRGLSNVTFIDLQPFDRLNELLNAADIHLLPQRADAADLVLPSKLTGMLASGRPVVATAHEDTELARLVQECGIVVEPECVDALVAAVRALADDQPRRRNLGKAGRRYAEENLSRVRIMDNFQCEALKLTEGGIGLSTTE